MLAKKRCIAMLLAGGQGSRLYALTNKVAKPAVSFGGKYRIIDFPLSNCINSNIDTVGVLTQYQPLLLNEYIGTGQPWDLDRNFGGVHILSPYQAKEGSEWYKGTANAIYQNLYYIKRYNPDNVLILSGDHIYKMNYAEMLDYHVSNNADCTIAAIRVPMDEASRFGILNVKENGEIYEFEEKPKNPKSNLASMGIYIFKAEKLYEYLESDAKKEGSKNDFGGDVLPAMLNAGEKMMSFEFNGYWKDVGTISSLYDANMDLLGDEPNFELNDRSWVIHSRNAISPPHYVGRNARIVNSLVISGCEIEGTVENSVLSHNVEIGIGAVVKNSIIFAGTKIGKNAVVENTIIDERVVVGDNAVIGKVNDNHEITVIGRELKIASGSIIEKGAMIDKDVK